MLMCSIGEEAIGSEIHAPMRRGHHSLWRTALHFSTFVRRENSPKMKAFSGNDVSASLQVIQQIIEHCHSHIARLILLNKRGIFMLYRQEMYFSPYIQICCIKFVQVGLIKEVNLFHRCSLLASVPRRPTGRRLKLKSQFPHCPVKHSLQKIMIEVWHLENCSQLPSQL